MSVADLREDYNNELLAQHINQLLTGGKENLEASNRKPFSWTGDQVNLVELIYGLYYTGQINHGNVEVKEIQEAVEQLFSVKIKAGYHVFGNIRRRKSLSPTAFLDKMRDSIQKRVDEDLAYHPHRDKLRPK